MKKILVALLAFASVSAFAKDVVCKAKMWEDREVTIIMKEGTTPTDLRVTMIDQDDLYKGLAVGLQDEKNVNITAIVKGELMSTMLKIKLPQVFMTKGYAFGQMQYLLGRDFETTKIFCEFK